jgi:hypothetical protein
VLLEAAQATAPTKDALKASKFRDRGSSDAWEVLLITTEAMAAEKPKPKALAASGGMGSRSRLEKPSIIPWTDGRFAGRSLTGELGWNRRMSSPRHRGQLFLWPRDGAHLGQQLLSPPKR